MDEGFIQWLAESRGFKPGDGIATKTQYDALYREFIKESSGRWELREDGSGNMVRANPQTGLVLAMTNQQGQPVKAGGGNPFDNYMAAPGVAGAAAVDPSSMAFTNVAPTNAPTGNAVAPVNVNPAVPAAAPVQRTAEPAVPAGQTNAAPVFRTADEVLAAARTRQLAPADAQKILVEQFGFDP